MLSEIKILLRRIMLKNGGLELNFTRKNLAVPANTPDTGSCGLADRFCGLSWSKT